jgi:hypothetical protein
MSLIYEGLINELKLIFLKKNIDFTKKNLRLIINKETTKKNKNIKKMLDDDELIEKIVNELEETSKKLHEIFACLTYLNELLIIFGEEPQASKKKAKKILKTKVFINIFDLIAGKYEKRTSKKLLIQDMIDNPVRIFPLKFAKGTAFQYFLQNIREEI